MKQNNRGFSLIETVVAMAILGAFTVSICTCLVLSLRMNEKTSTLLQEQMAVSSAVETLMAEGIPEEESSRNNFINSVKDAYKVSISATNLNDDTVLPYFNVSVTSNDGTVTVTTQIREAVTGE